MTSSQVCTKNVDTVTVTIVSLLYRPSYNEHHHLETSSYTPKASVSPKQMNFSYAILETVQYYLHRRQDIEDSIDSARSILHILVLHFVLYHKCYCVY